MKASTMPLRSSNDRAEAHYSEIARLITLTMDMLDRDREQVVRDYLAHALRALERLRESPPAQSPRSEA